MFSLGIDSGSTMTKGVLFDGINVVGCHMLPTSMRPGQILRDIYDRLYTEETGFVVSTGYGRELLKEADAKITEITCHGAGASYLAPGCDTVIDIGGQDCKVITLDSHGQVNDFLMNDKCAAGTGRFLQVVSGILGMELPELGLAAAAGKPVSISSMCAVFAETEIIGLLAQGTAPADIAAGVFLSIARRMRGLAARVPLRRECTFTGGLATSPAFSRLLAAELGVPVNVPDDPQTVGALGAALVAAR